MAWSSCRRNRRRKRYLQLCSQISTRFVCEHCCGTQPLTGIHKRTPTILACCRHIHVALWHILCRTWIRSPTVRSLKVCPSSCLSARASEPIHARIIARSKVESILHKSTIILANRTNGRACVVSVRLSVCLLSLTYVLWLNGASCRKYAMKQIGNGLSNNHVTADSTWLWKAKVMTSICFGAHYLDNGCR